MDNNDLGQLLKYFNKSGSWAQGDFDGNGTVDNNDLGVLLANYNNTLPSADPAAGSFPADVLFAAASIPTAVSGTSAISCYARNNGKRAGYVVPKPHGNGRIVVAISSPPGGVASGQAAVPATSSQSTVTAAASPATAPSTPLTLNSLKPVASEAIARWAGAGLNAGHSPELDQVPFVIGGLPGSSLGQAAGNRIALDTNAAENDGLVDSTPARSETVTPSKNNQPLPAVDPRAVDRIEPIDGGRARTGARCRVEGS